MLTEKNNMHDIDTWMFFKYFFKMMIAVYLVSHTFQITMAVFDVGQHVVNAASGVIGHDTAIDISSMISTMDDQIKDMEILIQQKKKDQLDRSTTFYQLGVFVISMGLTLYLCISNMFSASLFFN